MATRGLAGFLGGLGTGLAQYGQQEMQAQATARQLKLSEDVQMRRDERLQGYAVKQREAQAAAAARAAEQERMQAEADYKRDRADAAADGELAHSRDIELAQLDPKGTVVTVNNSPANTNDRQKKFNEALGTADANLFTETRKAADSAAKLEDAVHVLEQISTEFETGKAQEATARLGQYLGTDSGAALQAWEGAGSEALLSKMDAISGVLSDSDLAVLQKSIPTFGNDPRANSVIIGLIRKGINRARDNESSMQEHMTEHGSLNGWVAPNRQGTVSTPEAEANVSAADDPLGLF